MLYGSLLWATRHLNRDQPSARTPSRQTPRRILITSCNNHSGGYPMNWLVIGVLSLVAIGTRRAWPQRRQVYPAQRLCLHTLAIAKMSIEIITQYLYKLLAIFRMGAFVHACNYPKEQCRISLIVESTTYPFRIDIHVCAPLVFVKESIPTF